MNGNSVVLNSNVILYVLAGDASLARYLQPRSLFISIISEMEILSFQQLTAQEERKIRQLIGPFRIIGLDNAVKEEAIRIRKTSRLRLPDCIIAATAISLHLPLLTADKQFRTVSELDLEIYQPS